MEGVGFLILALQGVALLMRALHCHGIFLWKVLDWRAHISEFPCWQGMALQPRQIHTDGLHSVGAQPISLGARVRVHHRSHPCDVFIALHAGPIHSSYLSSD